MPAFFDFTRTDSMDGRMIVRGKSKSREYCDIRRAVNVLNLNFCEWKHGGKNDDIGRGIDCWNNEEYI